MLQSSVRSCDPFSAVLGGTQMLASKPSWSRLTMLRERGGGGSKEAKKNNCLGINLMALKGKELSLNQGMDAVCQIPLRPLGAVA